MPGSLQGELVHVVSALIMSGAPVLGAASHRMPLDCLNLGAGGGVVFQRPSGL